MDGTLIKTDMLIESFLELLSNNPFKAIKSLCNLLSPASLKHSLAFHADIDVTTIPYNQNVLDFVKSEKEKGRKIFLASASNIKYVKAVADYLGIFDGIFASNKDLNLKGKEKAKILCDSFSEKGFDYIGNSKDDFPVWEKANKVIAIGVSNILEKKIIKSYPEALILDNTKPSFMDYIKMIRIHQWLKNILIFVPAFLAHLFTISYFFNSLIAFFSFSFCASSVYILNDLLDIKNDRDHITKKNRPIASCKISLFKAVFIFPIFLTISIILSLFLPIKFLTILIIYYFITTAYSFYLKKKPIIDVLTLAALYGIRILAGSFAVSLPFLSSWFLSFSGFFFLYLALTKRCAELIERSSKGKDDPIGRGYKILDLPILQMFSCASGYVSVLVFCLYIDSNAVYKLYSNPHQLWLIPFILTYWISRTLLLTHRGNMNEDPVIFAAKDKQSLLCGIAIFLVLILSI